VRADGASAVKPTALPKGTLVGVFKRAEDYERARDEAGQSKKKEDYVKRTTAQQKRWVETQAKNEAIATAEHHACLDYRLSWAVNEPGQPDQRDQAGPSTIHLWRKNAHAGYSHTFSHCFQCMLCHGMFARCGMFALCGYLWAGAYHAPAVVVPTASSEPANSIATWVLCAYHSHPAWKVQWNVEGSVARCPQCTSECHPLISSHHPCMTVLRWCLVHDSLAQPDD
jgi:hypothetical protein